MLTDLATSFLDSVDQLDSGDDDYLIHPANLTRNLAKDAAKEIADHPYGEPAALIQLAGLVLQWIQSEKNDSEDRQRRYARQQSVLDLLIFCLAFVEHYDGSAAKQRENLAEHRARITDALRVP